jgi:hypothetical protein
VRAYFSKTISHSNVILFFLVFSHARQSFKSEFGKAYATQEEEDTRFGNFLSFLKVVDERN